MIQSDEIKALTTVLCSTGWLSDQRGEFQEWIMDSASWRHILPDGMVYMAGDKPDGLYGLAAGAVDLAVHSMGSESVSISRGEPGFWIGEAAILAGTRRAVSVRAIQPSTLVFVPRNKLVARLRQRPEWWQRRIEPEPQVAGLYFNVFHALVNLVNAGLPGYYAVPTAEDCCHRHPHRWTHSLPIVDMCCYGVEIYSLAGQLVRKGCVFRPSGDWGVHGDYPANPLRLMKRHLP
jgi:hypothetical protein